MRPVNLIPGEHRARQAGARPGSAYAVVGVLAGLLAMVAVYVLTANQVSERRTEAAEASQEAQRLEREAARLQAFTSFAAIKETRMAAVRSIASARFDWERLMRELGHVMPSGSWLQTTEASLAGGAGDPADPSSASTSVPAAGPPQPQATLVGCTPRQSEVARMMVRLRQMHRVTDVALNESAQAQDAGATTIDNCGTLYKFDLTVTFGPPDPSGEAPGDAAGVPARLGGGS